MQLRLPIHSILLVAGLGASQADLVGHWRFDEGSGTTYADSSNNGNDASQPGGGNLWSTDVPPTGIANTASLDFDGVGAYVSTPFVGIAGNAPRTVAAWIKTTHTAEHGIVAWGLSSTNGAKWHFRLNSNAANGPLGALRTETQGDFTIATTPLNDNQWHHVACVYPDGGGELGTVLHYVDGVLETAGGNNASTQAVNTSIVNDPVTIGRRTQGANNHYLDGGVDDVRIYDRALTAQEIVDLMGATPSTDGLVLYMPFEEGSGDTIDDSGSGDNDGLLIGSIPPPPPTWSNDAPPHLISSLQFADAGDILSTEFSGIAGTASRSVAFWFKTVSTTDNGILAWGNSTASGLKWHARINSAAGDGPLGALRIEIQDGRAVATTPVADGQWHHAAIVFEEDADPDISDVMFYVDGEADPISQFVSVPINTQTVGAGAGPVTLGGRYQGAALRGFLGNLADLRIYDTGLTQEEVQAIMVGAEPGPPLQLDISHDAGTLSIRWKSEDGMLYNLRSEVDPSATLPGAWPIFLSNENIVATPPLNTVSFALPEDAERFFVVEQFPPPPVTVFAENFESGQGAWTLGSDDQPGTVWEVGVPSAVGPPLAHSAPNCAATNLAADYAPSANIWLRSPPIDLTSAPGATLKFFQFVNIEETFSLGRISVLDAADDSEIAVIQSDIDGLTTDWEEVRRTIPTIALGRTVLIEFRLQTDPFGVPDYSGWYIDDIEVTVP